MKVRHRLVSGALLLALGLTLSAEPAKAASLGQERPALYRAFEWLSAWWQGGMVEGRLLSHLFAREGAGADPDGKTTHSSTAGTGSGSLSSIRGREGMGADPNGQPTRPATASDGAGFLSVIFGDEGAGSDPNGGH